MLGLAGLADALAIAGAIWATRAVAPCWWAPMRPAGWEPGALCERPGWGSALHAWGPAIVLVVVALASLGTAVVLVALQMMRARRATAGFGPRVDAGDSVAGMAAGLGIRRLVVVDDPRTSCCACVGLLRPRVVVSSGVVEALGGPELAAVLAHEASHARHADPLLVTLTRAAVAGLSFIPGITRLGRLAVVRAEQAADAAAVAAAGRGALCAALLALDEVSPAHGAMVHVASPEVIDLRIEALRTGVATRAHVVGRLLGGAVVIVLALCLVVSAWVAPSNEAPPVVAQVHRVAPN
ncbi:MAG: M56 family metallopeptidase [Acidimicrobiales bacterium]